MSHSARCAALACCCTRFNSCCVAWLPSAFTASMPAVRVSKYCPAGRRSSLAWSRPLSTRRRASAVAVFSAPSACASAVCSAGACCRARCRLTWLPLSNSSARVRRARSKPRVSAGSSPRASAPASMARIWPSCSVSMGSCCSAAWISAWVSRRSLVLRPLLCCSCSLRASSRATIWLWRARLCAGVTAPSPTACCSACQSWRNWFRALAWSGATLASSSAVACRVRPSSSRTAGRRPASCASPPSWPADRPRCTCVKRTDWPSCCSAGMARACVPSCCICAPMLRNCRPAGMAIMASARPPRMKNLCDRRRWSSNRMEADICK